MAAEDAVRQASDQERIVATMVLAFSADPALRRVYPDLRDYLSYFPEFVRIFAGPAFAHGTAYATADDAGAALWLPPGVHPNEEALVALLQRSVAEPDQGAVFAAFEQLGTYHPSEPHWYLAMIGVDPATQGKGRGTALLRHVLTQCDRDRAPAYLETSNPRNHPLYERLGFEVAGTIQGGEAPPVWPMVRQPR